MIKAGSGPDCCSVDGSALDIALVREALLHGEHKRAVSTEDLSAWPHILREPFIGTSYEVCIALFLVIAGDNHLLHSPGNTQPETDDYIRITPNKAGVS